MVQHMCDSEFSWCSADAKAGDFHKLRVKSLAPIQFAVGRAEVEAHAERMRKKLKKDPLMLHDYLRVRSVPIVVRGERFYLIDHHHLVRALYEVRHEGHGGDICVFVRVLDNWSSLEGP